MEGKKKLLMINGNQFGYSAGHYYYCMYLKDRFDIEYICYDRGRVKMAIEGVTVNYVPFFSNKFKRLTQFILNCIKISKRYKPDVLFVVYFNLSFILSLMCYGKKKILDIRSGSLSPNKFKRNIANNAIKFQSLFFKNIIVLSESLREFLNISPNKTLILPLGAEIYYTGSHNYKELNLLYIGTLDSRKIYETIEGLAIFLRKNTSYHTSANYTIIGFGTNSEIERIKKTILEHSLENIVKYEGIKNYNELATYLERANIGVAYFPINDEFQRQPATKIFEYGLSGLFTIATNTYENRRVLNPINGLLCIDTPESFSESLENYSNLYTSINSSDIRNSFMNYTWKNIVDSLLKPHLQKIN
jgi:hypothetical protein